MNNTYRNKPTTQQDLKILSIERRKALDLLYNNRLYNVVIADIGYPVELALKAAICKYKNFSEYPDINTYKSHNLNHLVKLCNLTNDLNKQKTNNYFFTSWSILSNWNVTLRYRCTGKNGSNYAESCIKSLNIGGVLHWIQSKW